MSIPWLQVFTDNTEADWKLVKFQPLLMAAMFVGGLILSANNLFLHNPSSHFSQDPALGLPHITWIALLIGCPLAWALTSAMIVKAGSARIRTWGLGLRLAGDIMTATAIVSYVITRLIVETYVMSGTILVAVGAFTLFIVGRDIQVMVLDRRRAE